MYFTIISLLYIIFLSQSSYNSNRTSLNFFYTTIVTWLEWPTRGVAVIVYIQSSIARASRGVSIIFIVCNRMVCIFIDKYFLQ